MDEYCVFRAQTPLGEAVISYKGDDMNGILSLKVGKHEYCTEPLSNDSLVLECYDLRRTIELLLRVDPDELKKIAKANNSTPLDMACDALRSPNSPVRNFISEKDFVKIKSMQFPAPRKLMLNSLEKLLRKYYLA